jgi:hypothetical protein
MFPQNQLWCQLGKHLDRRFSVKRFLYSTLTSLSAAKKNEQANGRSQKGETNQLIPMIP